MNKELRKTIRRLTAEGFTLKEGSSHTKIYDPGGAFFAVVPHGHNRDRVPGGADKELRRLVRRWEGRA